MNIDVLKAELLADHPVTGAYDADDAIAAEQLNEKNCSRDKPILTGSQVLNAIDKAEFLGKTAEEKQRVWNLLHLGELNPHGVEADLMIDIFGPTSATITTLKLLRVEAISRGVELHLGEVKAGHVEEARRNG